ncbi:MAG: glutathione S-transferase family protein [Methylococcales bacterium]|nr:glutathione S-transferase family protein [Methylococcales bacterium]
MDSIEQNQDIGSPIRLYDMELSGNCYKIRLFCGLLNLKYQIIPVNLFKAEHKQPAFLQINPRGQIPVLDDNGRLIWDSAAILVYLARKYADEQWLPLAAESMAETMQWLAMAENELLYGLARARAAVLFNRPWNLAECQALGGAGLTVLEQQLQKHDWLAVGRATIADVACYPYVVLAPEGGVSLDGLPHVQAWIARIQALPGYVGMPGIQISTV